MKTTNLLHIFWRILTVFALFFACVYLIADKDIFLLLTMCIWGFICSNQANKKGLNTTWAFVYGTVWGLFAVIWYLAEDYKVKTKGYKPNKIN